MKQTITDASITQNLDDATGQLTVVVSGKVSESNDSNDSNDSTGGGTGEGGGLIVEDIDDRADGGGGTSGDTTVNLTGGNLIATSAYKNLEDAFAAIGDAPTTLMVNSVIQVSTDLAQPANIVLFFVGGGRIDKTGAGKLTALNYTCNDEYQICFSGFNPGDLKFGLKMPTKVSYCHFGAVANRFGGDIVAAMAGADTIPAVDLVANALTHTTQDNMPQGTIGYFPQGDFNFSKEWTNTKSLAILGAESNTYWEKATRLFFPIRTHGVAQRRQRDPVTGAFISRTIGNIMKNFEVVQDHRWYTDSTVKISGSRTFAPADVDVSANTIALPGHLYETGEKIEYSSTKGWAAPLNDYDTGGIYYIIKIDDDTVSLARNYADAMAGKPADLTAQGEGVHRVTSWEMRYFDG